MNDEMKIAQVGEQKVIMKMKQPSEIFPLLSKANFRKKVKNLMKFPNKIAKSLKTDH